MGKRIWLIGILLLWVVNSEAQVTSGTVNSRTDDGVGNKITSTIVGPSRALDVNVVQTVGGGGGGTSSTFGAAFPATGTAMGLSDGTPNMRPGFAVDADTGAGTQYAQGVNLVFRSVGGPIEAGILANPLRTDPTGTTIQPVNGTVAVSNAFLLDATFTSRINTLGQKAMAASTPVVLASDQASIPVAATVSNAFLLDATFTGRFAAAFLDADAIANQTTTAVHGFGYMFNGATWDRVRGTIAGGLLVNVSNASLAVTGSLGRTWTLASGTDSVAAVQSGTWNIGTLTSITNTVTVQGTKSNNAGVPGTNNEGVLPCIATAVAPIYVEGNQVGCSTDLAGNGRITGTVIQASQSGAVQTFIGVSSSSVALLNISTTRQTLIINNVATSALCVTFGVTSSLNTCAVIVKPGQIWSPPDTVVYRGALSGRWFANGIGEALITDIPGG